MTALSEKLTVALYISNIFCTWGKEQLPKQWPDADDEGRLTDFCP
jgi:hypothetical protein